MAAQLKQNEFGADFEPAPAPTPAPASRAADIEAVSEEILPVLDDLASAPSPARALQEQLEVRITNDATSAISPRQVLATIIVICLAFWLSMYQLALAIF